jgi:hypothetical protein
VFETPERLSLEVHHNFLSRGMHGTRSVTLGTYYFGGKRLGVFENPEHLSLEVDHSR